MNHELKETRARACISSIRKELNNCSSANSSGPQCNAQSKFEQAQADTSGPQCNAQSNLKQAMSTSTSCFSPPSFLPLPSQLTLSLLRGTISECQHYLSPRPLSTTGPSQLPWQSSLSTQCSGYGGPASRAPPSSSPAECNSAAQEQSSSTSMTHERMNKQPLTRGLAW